MKKLLFAVMLFLLGTTLHVPTVSADVKVDEGAALRLRHEVWDDLVDLDTGIFGQKDRSFFRFRTNVWANAAFSKNFDTYLRLTNEAKYYTGPFKPNTPRNTDNFDEDEIVIDNLYADAKNLLGGHVDLRVGRQDFLGPTQYGDGFLLLDGTPNDGSRTFYFNAAKATVHLNDNNAVDLVYIADTQKDIYLPSMFGEDKRTLNISNEQGFMVYDRSKVSDNLSLEPYYIYKIEHSFNDAIDKAFIPELDLNTVGMRAVVTAGTWKIRGEYAHQFGDYKSGSQWQDRRGDGGYIFVGRKYDNIALKPEFDLGYVYLSGDNPNTKDKNEAWDPLFSRAPEWNELMIYTYIFETARYGGPIPGYWTNLNLYKIGFTLHPDSATALALSYQYLTAPERTDGLNPAMFSNSGKARGHLPTAILTHTFSKNVDAMAQFEYLIPESFYASHDNATFLRLQLQIKI